MNFADIAIEKRKIDYKFFNSINEIINWKNVEELIHQYYKKGRRIDGRPAYPGLLLFKLCLLKQWYSLTDHQLVAHANDSISFIRFLNLSLEDDVPSPSTIRQFRAIMMKTGASTKLQHLVKQELEKNRISIQKGKLMNARIIELSANQ